MSHRYILDGHRPIPCPDLITWANWYETSKAERIVKQTMIGECEVSTVFIGLDMSFADESPRQLFETMVFGGDWDGERRRCATWEDAERQHIEMVIRISHPRPDYLLSDGGDQ